MRWLVTGGCGFIGRTLIRLLLSRSNETIRVVDNLSVGTRDDLRQITMFTELDPEARATGHSGVAGLPQVELMVGDVRDAGLAERVTAGVDVVVHLAANTGVEPSVADPRLDCLINVIGTFNYLEACRRNGVAKFVFASSGAPIGECEPPIHEELAPHPVSPYGASKLAGEAYCSAYNRSFGLHTVALRFGNCYGPLSTHKGSVVAKFIREAMAGQAWEIYGDGRQTRDFIFVDDIAEAIIRSAIAEGIGGETFQIATNAETTLLELANKLQDALRRNGVAPIGIRHGDLRVGDVKRSFSDTRKAKRMLGWSAHMSLDEGLDRTVKWFLSQDQHAKKTISGPHSR
jgi:UDP-glucose 4-epimerase